MPKAKERKADPVKIKKWLKAHGHKAADVDGKRMGNQAEIVASVCELVGVTAAEYERARKKGASGT